MPLNRIKRGLWNPLGTFIKSISGNLDQEDYSQIQDSIKKLENGNYAVSKMHNKQVEINELMIQRFENITDHINNLTNEIEKLLQERTHYTNYQWNMFFVEEFFYKIEDSIQLLQDQINEIHEIITFAKIEVISRHILDGEELNYIHEHLNNNNVQISSDEQVYSMLNLKAYYNKTNIVLAVEIPHFHKDPLTFYHIKPTPINNTQIIKINTNSIILNNLIYMEVHKSCPAIENVFFCKREQIYNISNSCIPQLILNKNAQCDTKQIEDYEEIDYMEAEYLYVSSTEGIKFSSTCNFKNGTIKGKKLLNFKNCSITINNERYTNEYKIKNHKIFVIQPFDELNMSTNMETLISLPRLSKQTIENTEKLEHIQTQSVTYDYMISGTTLILIAIISIFVYYLFRKYLIILNSIKQYTIPFKNILPMTSQVSSPLAESSKESDNEDVINLRREELQPVPSHHVQRSNSLHL